MHCPCGTCTEWPADTLQEARRIIVIRAARYGVRTLTSVILERAKSFAVEAKCSLAKAVDAVFADVADAEAQEEIKVRKMIRGGQSHVIVDPKWAGLEASL